MGLRPIHFVMIETLGDLAREIESPPSAVISADSRMTTQWMEGANLVGTSFETVILTPPSEFFGFDISAERRELDARKVTSEALRVLETIEGDRLTKTDIAARVYRSLIAILEHEPPR